jgi:4'-phosphopantetheinyl transferase
MEVRPDQLQFETQPQGKPVLITASSFPIQFNVSHTRGVAFIALTTQHAVGIDVEWIDRKVQDRDIAERYFSTRESEYLASLAPPERTHQFFSYWTCKEAYLKARPRESKMPGRRLLVISNNVRFRACRSSGYRMSLSPGLVLELGGKIPPLTFFILIKNLKTCRCSLVGSAAITQPPPPQP